MKNITCDIDIMKVEAQSLSDKDFQELYEVIQDMWAQSIGEYIKCTTCWKIQGKKEIFWHLAKEIYENTVTDITRILNLNTIQCPCCGWDTNFIYWPEHIQSIKDKLLTSKLSRLGLVKEKWNIVGTALYYKDTFEKIFNYELQDHYASIWIEKIRDRIKEILWYNPQDMIAFSTLGFIEKFRNPFHFFSILQSAWKTLLEIGWTIPWIMELDKYNPIHRVFIASWWVSLEIKKIMNTPHISNTAENYESDLIILPDSVQSFQDSFARWPRAFLRKLATT